MNIKFFISIVVCSLIGFFGGWVIFGIIFDNYYSANTNESAKFLRRAEPVLWAVSLATIAWSTILTWIIQKTGSSSFRKGFITGIFVSLPILILFNMNIYAFWNFYELNFILVDIFIGSVFWALIGGFSGMILGIKPAPVTSSTEVSN